MYVFVVIKQVNDFWKKCNNVTMYLIGMNNCLVSVPYMYIRNAVKQDGRRHLCLCLQQGVLAWHKPKYKHKMNKKFCPSCCYMCACVVCLLTAMYLSLCLFCGDPHYFYAQACAYMYVTVKARLINRHDRILQTVTLNLFLLTKYCKYL